MDFNVHCAVLRTIHTNNSKPKTALWYIHTQIVHSRAEQSKPL